MKLLLIDDDKEFLSVRKAFLSTKGCLVDTAETAEKAIVLISANQYDCIVLDVLLEEISGFTLCTQIKKISEAPVIFLSNLSDEASQTQGFLSGGDDYIHKLCGLNLFWLKLRKRVELYKKEDSSSIMNFSPLVIDLKKRKVTLNGIEITLTNAEFDILSLIASAPNRLWTLTEIYTEVWGQDALDHIQTVQVHISRLRGKIEKAFPYHYFIETVWGKGYQFVPISCK